MDNNPYFRKTMELRKEELEKILLKVTKKLKIEDKIKTKYSFFRDLCLDINYATDGKLIMVKPVLIAGDFLFRLERKEKEAAVAHEIAQYKIATRYLNPERMIRQDKWHNQFNCYCLKRDLDKEGERHFKKLYNWLLMEEIYADNEVVRIGYAAPLISVLKKIVEQVSMLNPKSRLYKITLEANLARIENLEKN